MKDEKKKDRPLPSPGRGSFMALLQDLNGQLQGYLKSLKTAGPNQRSD